VIQDVIDVEYYAFSQFDTKKMFLREQQITPLEIAFSVFKKKNMT